MNTTQMRTTSAGPHILTRPIDDGGNEPVDHLILDGKRVGVDEVFEPTEHWKAKNGKLFQEIWEYAWKTDDDEVEWRTEGPETPEEAELVVARRLKTPYVIPVEQKHKAELRKAVEEEDHAALGDALEHFTDEIPRSKDERIAVAQYVLGD